MSFVPLAAETMSGSGGVTCEIGVFPSMSDFLSTDCLARVFDEKPDLAARLAGLFPRVACFTSAEVASRVSLADAAHMAEVTPDSLLAFLNRAGHDLVAASDPAEGASGWVRAAELAVPDLPHIDASAILDGGRDPLSEILAVADTVAEKAVFVVEAPFDPVPLRNLLAGKGFSSHARRLEEGRWRVLFRRDGQGVALSLASDGPASGDDDVLDLRGLEPPQPLVAILRRIDGGDGGDGFAVILERDPVFLYPELEDRGWVWCHRPAGDGEVRLELAPEGLVSGGRRGGACR